MNFYKTPFAFVTPLFIIGALVGGTYQFDYGVALLALVAILIGLYFIPKLSKSTYTLGLALAFFLLGAEVMDSYRDHVDSGAGTESTVIVEIVEAEINNKPWKKAIGNITHLKNGKSIESCSERVLLFTQTQMEQGDQILVSSDFRKIRNQGNPGEFDARSYWANKSIFKMAFVGESDFKFITHDPPKGLASFFNELRGNLSDALDENLEEEQASIAKALLLGDKSALSIETKQSFSNAGAMHVLAVSGLHVGIIMYLLMFVLGRFSRFISKRTSVVICVLFIWCYAGVTGFSPSVMRASFMFSVLMLGQVWSRGTNSMNTLFFSAMILLLINPMLIYDIGFQLSYLAVLGILLTYDRVSGLILIRNKWIRMVWDGTAIGISAQVFTIPLTLYYFHQFPNYFMISNVGIMILAGVLLSVGLFFFAIKGLVFLKPYIAIGLGLGLNVLLFFIQFVDGLPGSVATGFQPSIWVVLLMYALILALIVFNFDRRWKAIGGIVVILLLVGLQWDRFQRMKENEIVFYNSNVPVFTIKQEDRILCFHLGKEDDLKKVKMLTESYAKVKPGELEYHQLKEGKMTLNSNTGTIEITTLARNVYLKANGKTYFLRSRYKTEERIVDRVVDLPYIAGDKSHYNLKDGAFIVEL